MNKKTFLFIAVGIFFASCAKEYTCECDGTAASLGIQSYSLKYKKEADAKEKCDSYADNTGGLVICTLK